MVSAFKFKGGAGVTKPKKTKKAKQKAGGDLPNPTSAGSGREQHPGASHEESSQAEHRKRTSLSPESAEILGREVAEARATAGTGPSSKSTVRPAARSKTQAQLQWEERQRKNEIERIKRQGVKTHVENVREFNEKLANRTEHNDMPKIGPG